jgi:TDG/mug DNA glycosylase family protein
MNATKSSFAAIADGRTRVLLLGSLPGEESLARAQYYAHPRNLFWRLMEPVVGAALAGRPYAERLETLAAAGVGLWDVIRSARRAGSLDAAIRDHEPNALPAFVGALPSLKAVAFNGGKAAAIGRLQLGGAEGPALVNLPSSSPAYAAMPFADKQAAWLRLKDFLPPDA